jgi:Uma2 family endonuclease
MFYTAERFVQFKQAYPDWESIPAVGAPDFVAEIVSPTDRFSEVSGKVARYLNDGVRLIWVIDREAKSIQAHTPDSNQIMTYSGSDTLSADPIVPGFTLDLKSFFSA